MNERIITSAAVADLDVATRTATIQQAIDALVAQGGGQLTLQAGDYEVGSLQLGSHLTLYLEAGARLKFSNQIDLYPTVKSRWEGATRLVYRACLYGNQLTHVKLAGDGIIDGQGARWWQRFENHEAELEYPRPYLYSVEHSKQVVIDGLTFTNSPAWTLHPFDCDNVWINGTTVINPKNSPNTDGLDPESCRNVRITNCCFDVGDDCIAIKAGTEEAAEAIACENIIISGCNMSHGHGGVVFGSEMSGDIRNVTITNCTFQDTDRGIRFKTRRGRGGKISEIMVTNIVMDNVLCPLIVNAYYFCGPHGGEPYVWTKDQLPVDERTPQFENLSFSHLFATNVRSCAAFIYGLPEMPIKSVSLSDAHFSLSADAQPEAPAMIADAPELAQAGVFIENTAHASLQNVQVSGASDFYYNERNNDQLVKN
ncbi:glycoside hydrolase family 28 protein [Lactiplantibacillus modestisalitolerans]|uniref:Glycoside hydrolase family 28 protein n=1 Tax=Lactiplantibacillus modestisalitolerans TaxID=1457219 RepID=A0ABV5WU21_9LACO|nr:glycoside hydrolase family 28 protein [Lactiplantibacillus modestisalitolerans]